MFENSSVVTFELMIQIASGITSHSDFGQRPKQPRRDFYGQKSETGRISLTHTNRSFVTLTYAHTCTAFLPCDHDNWPCIWSIHPFYFSYNNKIYHCELFDIPSRAQAREGISNSEQWYICVIPFSTHGISNLWYTTKPTYIFRLGISKNVAFRGINLIYERKTKKEA